jgi:hypothetical protein
VFADPNLKRPYSDQWNFGVQQQVTPKVDKLIGSWNLNGIVSFSSGALFDVGTGKDLANAGNQV